MHDVLVVPETKSLLRAAWSNSSAQASPGHGGRRIRLDRRSNQRRRRARATGRRTGRRIRRRVRRNRITDANAPLVLDGAVNIRDLESQYDLKLPQDEGFETLAGFVLSRLQKMPTGGEAVRISGPSFRSRKNGRPPHRHGKNRTATRSSGRSVDCAGEPQRSKPETKLENWRC